MITKPILFTTTLAALFGSCAATSAQSKTITPERVKESLLDEAPFRHNGVLISGESRGSAFRAWHPNTIFTAAHVVFLEDAWGATPTWYPQPNSRKLDETSKIRTRGYVRWNDYARLATETLDNSKFSKDLVIAYAFRSLGKGAPAKIDTGGTRILNSRGTFTITGYPGENAYLGVPIKGFFLHRTQPTQADFRTLSGRAITTSLITTGAGNSGGPVWVRNASKKWVAGGVLTGGLPSESIIYGFTSEINPLLRAVEPVVSKPQILSNGVPGVSASSMFFPYQKRQIIPDGVPRWSSFTVGVGAFENEATVSSIKLDLDIRTTHRGDLQVMLSSPEGINVLVSNEEGAGEDDLILKQLDLSEQFAGAVVNGPWTLRIQDRLKGDISELRSFRLEISTEGSTNEEPEEFTGTIGNIVFEDSDADGQLDPDEIGIDDVTVTLFRPGFGEDGIAGNSDDDRSVDTVITADGGLYSFTGLGPGTYQVNFGDLDGYTRTLTDRGEDRSDSDANADTGLTANIRLAADETNNTIDAGYFQTVP